MTFRGLVVSLALLGWAGAAPAQQALAYGERDEVKSYVREVAAQHGLQEQQVLTLLSQAQRRDDIIEKISRPAERVWTWARYRRLLVDPARVEKGVDFWRTHEPALQRAAQVYGVDPQFIVAVLGVETRYGEVTGDYRVLDALMTLGFDYPPRAQFFRGQLTELLLLAREERKDPRSLLGSYAGAMGYGQFIPSSFRSFAVDFDGDGLRDIWANPTDAIGSIANYFARHGWRGTGSVAVRLQEPKDAEAADGAANNGLEPRLTADQLRRLGLRAEFLGPEEKAALFKLEGQQGVEYWLGLHDFYVITRYNHSHLYAMAVYQLSEEIRTRRDAQT